MSEEITSGERKALLRLLWSLTNNNHTIGEDVNLLKRIGPSTNQDPLKPLSFVLLPATTPNHFGTVSKYIYLQTIEQKGITRSQIVRMKLPKKTYLNKLQSLLKNNEFLVKRATLTHYNKNYEDLLILSNEGYSNGQEKHRKQWEKQKNIMISEMTYSNNMDIYNEIIVGFWLTHLASQPNNYKDVFTTTMCSTIHFAYTYDWFKLPQVSLTGIPTITMNQYHIQQYTGITLQDYWFKMYLQDENTDVEDTRSFFITFTFQLIHGLGAAWAEYGFSHNDLHAKNITMTETPMKTVGKYEYKSEYKYMDYYMEIEDKKHRYRVPLKNYKHTDSLFFLKIIDFGRSRIVTQHSMPLDRVSMEFTQSEINLLNRYSIKPQYLYNIVPHILRKKQRGVHLSSPRMLDLRRILAILLFLTPNASQINKNSYPETLRRHMYLMSGLFKDDAKNHQSSFTALFSEIIGHEQPFKYFKVWLKKAYSPSYTHLIGVFNKLFKPLISGTGRENTYKLWQRYFTLRYDIYTSGNYSMDQKNVINIFEREWFKPVWVLFKFLEEDEVGWYNAYTSAYNSSFATILSLPIFNIFRAKNTIPNKMDKVRNAGFFSHKRELDRVTFEAFIHKKELSGLKPLDYTARIPLNVGEAVRIKTRGKEEGGKEGGNKKRKVVEMALNGVFSQSTCRPIHNIDMRQFNDKNCTTCGTKKNLNHVSLEDGKFYCDLHLN